MARATVPWPQAVPVRDRHRPQDQRIVTMAPSTLSSSARTAAKSDDASAASGAGAAPAARQALLHFVMIKPTHYDEDGYPIQWFRSAIPSNTPARLNARAEAACRRNVLAPA